MTEFKQVEDKSLIGSLFSKLTGREKEVLEDTHIYGESAGDIANKLGISRTRVQQIQKDALKKIKRTSVYVEEKKER